jgi:acetyl esterase/lipase
LLLDIVCPVVKADTPLPVILYIHGGGWMGGDKAAIGGRHNATFAAHGFIAVSINHRLSGEAIFPAQIHDCKAAVRWLRANAETYNIDPNKIGVWGHSSGGHLAALLGTSGQVPELEGESGNEGYSSAVQAVCASAAPIDLLQMGDWHDEANSPEARLLGASYIKDRPDLAKQASPFTYINDPAQVPPFLLIHGEQDQMVPFKQSKLLYEALQDVSFVRLKQGDHADYNGGNMLMEDLLPTILSFFRKNLVGPKQTTEEIQATRDGMQQFINHIMGRS